MPKLLPMPKERREKERHQLEQLMPLNVLREEGGGSIACRLHDLSPDGLCVLVREVLPVGTRLRFVTLKREFLLEVAWCDAKKGNAERRCGLTLRGGREDMHQLFVGFSKDRSAG